MAQWYIDNYCDLVHELYMAFKFRKIA